MVDSNPETQSGGGQALVAAASEQAGQVSSAAVGQAGEVAGAAADHARQVASQAASQAAGLVDEARGAVRRQADAQTSQLGEALGGLRDQFQALLDGRPEDAPSLAGHGREVVGRLDRLAGRLQSGGVDGALAEVQRFARRRPGAFLAGAGLAGFAAGRLLRASRERDGSSGSGGGGAEGATGDRAWPYSAQGLPTEGLPADDPTVVPAAETGMVGLTPPPPPPPPLYGEYGGR